MLNEISLVSIIMPAYNSALYIAESIESILAQTYPYWELLVVDDGSTDNTKEIVQIYVNKDSRITYLYQSNGKQGKARNLGISKSKGEYIAFLDADDLWLPEKLKIQIDALRSTDFDLIYSNSYLFEDRFDLSSTELLRTEADKYFGKEGLVKFLQYNRMPILTVVCKRVAIIQVGGFTENSLIQNAEDYHLWLKLQLAGFKFFGTKHVLAAYRRHNASVSNNDRLNTKQLVEAQYDLYINNPERSEFLFPFLIQKIKDNLYWIAKYDDNDLYFYIEKYLKIYNRELLLPLFSFYKKVKLRDLAIRSVYFIFNYF